MLSVDKVGAVKVGDGTGDFDNFEVRASGEIELNRSGVKVSFSSGSELEQR